MFDFGYLSVGLLLGLLVVLLVRCVCLSWVTLLVTWVPGGLLVLFVFWLGYLVICLLYWFVGLLYCVVGCCLRVVFVLICFLICCYY